MNRIGSFLLGLMVGAVGLYLSMHFTLVRAGDGFHLIRKISPKLENPYADVRQYTLANWQKKQSLALAILKSNKGHLISDQSFLSFKQSSQRILDQFSLGSATGFQNGQN
jgi:hypothetical protein